MLFLPPCLQNVLLAPLGECFGKVADIVEVESGAVTEGLSMRIDAQ